MDISAGNTYIITELSALELLPLQVLLELLSPERDNTGIMFSEDYQKLRAAGRNGDREFTDGLVRLRTDGVHRFHIIRGSSLDPTYLETHIPRLLLQKQVLLLTNDFEQCKQAMLLNNHGYQYAIRAVNIRAVGKEVELLPFSLRNFRR